ncbi:SANT and BTB domain regulator of class switch recombination-like isoform X2 [Corticium candelabrum]|uniref:SANT and BTB domain regulator of class switch recombination-like isoform X2 n=1 Tax=Corticium candelabrum TaxID=121492 RepID=UPI002E2551AE|nr:SANT and BTB domain regulator of class switch recombination-like isoform X2 [Corticium candelabrum]
MSRSSSGVRPVPPTSRLVTLDLMLRTFMNSVEFTRMEPKNWDAVARLVPGTTARECAKRWKELLLSGLAPQGAEGLTAQGRPFSTQSQTQHLSKFVKSMLQDSRKGNSSTTSESTTNTKTEVTRKLSLSQKAVTSELRSESSNSLMALSSPPSSSETKKPTKSSGENLVMVIHVCDEAKKIQRDFMCPRDLLMHEMPFFTERLSDEAHLGKLFDISVHCDVSIFQWLMSYVKRGMPDDKGVQIQQPKIESHIVVSLLVSSNYLLMEPLVEQCINYIHDNISTVVAAPSNMNCIADELLDRIAKLFDHKEIEEFRDKRDRFKSKLYFKKVQELFDLSHSSSQSPANASTLFRCSHCCKLMTHELQWKLKCVPSSMTIGYRGEIMYNHSRDPSWDVNNYLVGLCAQGQTWRQIYWKIWSLINALHCVRCGQTFQCAYFSRCAYHPQPSSFEPLSATGKYPCCETKCIRFGSLEQNEGCSFRDHEVLCGDASLTRSNSSLANSSSILDIVIQYRDLIYIQHKDTVLPNSLEVPVNVFSKDEEASCLLTVDEAIERASSSLSNLTQGVAVTGYSQLVETNSDTDDLDTDLGQEEEDDDDETEEDASITPHVFSAKSKHRSRGKKFVLHSSREGSPFQGVKLGSERKKKVGRPCLTWDLSKSLRWNQDNQREIEEKRMQNLMLRLTSNRPLSKSNKSKDHPGGMFCQLEEKWRARHFSSKPSSSSSNQTRRRIFPRGSN